VTIDKFITVISTLTFATIFLLALYAAGTSMTFTCKREVTMI